jgi:hypothetical protein
VVYREVDRAIARDRRLRPADREPIAQRVIQFMTAALAEPEWRPRTSVAA